MCLPQVKKALYQDGVMQEARKPKAFKKAHFKC